MYKRQLQQKLSPEELREKVAKQLEIDPAAVQVLADTGKLSILEGRIETRGFLGLFKKVDQQIRVIDNEGVIRLQKKGGSVHPIRLDHQEADLHKAIAEGKLDLVAMARAWISNPNYGDLLYEGRKEDLVPCLRCNKCHGRGKRDILTTVCSVNPKFGFEEVDRYLVTPVKEQKNIAIISGAMT